jgi:hypothetical protein
VALVTGAPARASDESERLQVAELEATLARDTGLYLVLDARARELTVKVRGIALSTTKLSEVSRLVFQPLLGGAEAPPLPAPAVWRISEGPGDTDRETIAPTTLRPYSEEEERQEPTAPGATPAAPKKDENEKPPAYRVKLENGWQLMVVNEPPRLGPLRRLSAAVRDGWLRLRGEEPSHPPLVALVMAPADAKALHHLFRTDIPILALPAD